MTYEEAKMQIQAIPEKIWDQLSEPDREAMEMAFSALQEQEAKAQLSAEGTTSDLISRRVAIDALGYCQTYLFDSRDKDKKISLEDAEYAIEQLPSAQPEIEERKEESAQNVPKEDLISRKAAIDAINKALDRETLVNSFVRKVAVDAVKVLPPAQPELSDAVYQLWKRAYEAGERSTQPEIIHCRDCRYSTDFYQDGCCYCKRPSKKMRYIEEGWDFYCAAGKENR